MSFFPRTFVSNDPTSFHPLFRLLDDFDSYNRGSPTNNHNQAHNHHRGGSIMKSFTPKFDVKELGEAYELHGELPGVSQKDVEIEFTDSQTVVIRGKTERTFTSGTPPAGLLESNKSAGAIEGDKTHADHHATVEDETPAEDSQVAKKDAKKEEKPAEPQEKYWVSERSVGEFSRSFTFPVRVDSENVQASMKDGILTLVVPKAKKDQARKITIN
ncbi:30 kDa heat shock [Hyphodiscus hymeniophilus]|uniref:30 kDa heat shock n=1 Tax=Hyphodiscus hymeniophilus TaxID=353542 RepID=A0A9P6VMQ6_9HELO|nr:30 kDa heat shock [Hyphodiscus hymeniophilus]